MVTRKRKMTLSSDSGPSKRLKTRSSLRSNTKPKPVVIKFSCHKPKNSSLGTTDCTVPPITKKLPIKVSENEKVLLEYVSESMESEENHLRIDEGESNLESHNVQKSDTLVKKKDGKSSTKRIDTKISCDYCDQNFSSIIKLQSHHEKTHKVTLLEKVDTNVDKPFDKKSYESAKPYLEAHCTHCANSYTSQPELGNHIKMIHEFDQKTSAKLSELYSSYITWENKEPTINVFCNLCKSKLAAVSNIKNWHPLSHWQHCSKQFSEQNIACEQIGNIAKNNFGKNVDPNLKDLAEDINVVEDFKDATSSCEQEPNSSNSKENKKTLEEIMYPDLPDVEFEPIKQATRSAKNATPSIDNDQNLAKNAKFVPNSSSQKSDTAFPCSYKGRKLFEDLKDATSSCENSSKSKENKKTLEEIMYPDLLEDVHVDLLVDKNIEENFDQDIEYITIVEEFKIEAEDALISSEGANANVLVEKDFEENIQENCHPNEETSDEEIKVVGLSLAKLSKVKIEDFKVELLDHEQAESSLQSKENKTLDEKIDTFEERSEQSATKVNFATWVKEMNFDKFVNKILHVNATNDNEVNQILPRDSLTKEITNVISFSDNTDSDEVAVSIDTENYSEAHCTHCEVIYTRYGNTSCGVFKRGIRN